GGTVLGQSVFEELVKCGAPQSILVDALPHIGTDNLVNVVANLRDKIISDGGKFMFDTVVTDLLINNGAVEGVTVKNNGKVNNIKSDFVILACGHSARDTFEMLYNLGINMQFKPFAVGVRIEHGRDFINTAQYGKLFATHRDLGSASYKLTHKCADGHGCYSFCMCPGGVVVSANSQPNTVVVNGMSNYLRNEVNSNSALVVTVSDTDVAKYGYGTDVFAGMRFQQDLERKAYIMGGGNYIAPSQNTADFVNNRLTTQFEISPSYPRGVKPCNLRDLLPKQLCDNLAESLLAFDRKIKGFGTSGVLTAVETRTSSPIKILRNETYQSNIKGLYPVGEGAGYAGGIVSSAVDGLKIAKAIVEGI
ncbi:MAG: FAD-binding protein, partial [Clostridia bacterium]|nr:FAD-binding protein [Clostridia bacterium]